VITAATSYAVTCAPQSTALPAWASPMAQWRRSRTGTAADVAPSCPFSWANFCLCTTGTLHSAVSELLSELSGFLLPSYNRKEVSAGIAHMALRRLTRRFKAQRYATLAAFQADLEDESVKSAAHSQAMRVVREGWDCLRQRLQVRLWFGMRRCPSDQVPEQCDPLGRICLRCSRLGAKRDC
jgi:hypothetical protein